MTPEDIIRMAREAGASLWQKKNCEVDYLFGVEELRCFAALVAAAAKAEEREHGQKWFDAVTAQHKQEILAEREACAKLADAADMYNRFISQEIAAAIRARGETK